MNAFFKAVSGWKRIVFTLGILLVCFLSGNSLFAQQQGGVAKLQEGVVQIDEVQPLEYSYFVSLPVDEFQSLRAATQHFRQFNSQLVTFTVLEDGRLLQVDIEFRTKAWTAKDWNRYLSDRMKS